MVCIHEAGQDKSKQKARGRHVALRCTCLICALDEGESLPVGGQVGLQEPVGALLNLGIAEAILLSAGKHALNVRQSHMMRVHAQGCQLANWITTCKVSHTGIPMVHRKALARVMHKYFLIGLIELAEVVVLSSQTKGFHEEALIAAVVFSHA